MNGREVSYRLPLRYLAATRPPFLVASALPVAIGLAGASADGIAIEPWSALLTLTGALCAHAAFNVSNDCHDDLNGTDRINQQLISPFTGGSRLIQNGTMSLSQMTNLATMLYLTTIVVGLVLLIRAGPLLLVPGCIGLLIGWGYSAPPLRLNSRGLGEPTVAIGFGLLISAGTDLVQRGDLSTTPLLLAAPCGLLTTAVLLINQFPDQIADAASGKAHWVVRLGPQQARWLYLPLTISAYLLLVVLIGSDRLPVAAIAGLAPLPLSIYAGRQLIRHAAEPQRLRLAIIATLLAMVLHGVLLSLAILVAGRHASGIA
jgi:1,4-dihydroxy-2-naphthoate octaprenyltransferase